MVHIGRGQEWCGDFITPRKRAQRLYTRLEGMHSRRRGTSWFVYFFLGRRRPDRDRKHVVGLIIYTGDRAAFDSFGHKAAGWHHGWIRRRMRIGQVFLSTNAIISTRFQPSSVLQYCRSTTANSPSSGYVYVQSCFSRCWFCVKCKCNREQAARAGRRVQHGCI